MRTTDTLGGELGQEYCSYLLDYPTELKENLDEQLEANAQTEPLYQEKPHKNKMLVPSSEILAATFQ